ncbi:MAG: omptin family outer membrane protease [Spirochaetaceae bacterium]|jgi:outer membrane protease|nr:omptin family outer membrane protease [Spirochaetaceae bacterium]
MKSWRFSLICTLLLLTLNGKTFGADILTKPEPFTLTLEPIFGVIAGSVDEYVYEDDYLLSKLVWDMKPLFYIGVSTSLTVYGVELSASLTLGLPGNSGVMEDFDYLNYNSAVTNYSISQAKIRSRLQTDVSLGYEFNLLDRFTITPFWEFRYRVLSFEGYGGYYQYPPEWNPPYTEWTPDAPKSYFTGSLITYHQQYLFTGFGFSGSADISERLSLSLLFRFSPLVWCTAVDHHILGAVEYLDDMNGGYTLGGELSLLFRFTERNALRLGGGYEYTGDLRGPNASRRTGMVSSDYIAAPGIEGGTKNSQFSVTLSVISEILPL